VVHLICLHCSRPNPSEAKFCSQCGAGLLRRFCGQCHAVNDADSHFCQWCGAALSAQPLPAASSPPPSADVPVLTDVVVASEETGAPPSTASLTPPELPPSALVAEALPQEHPPRVVWTAHRPVLFVFGGVAVLLVAAALWTRPLHTGVTTGVQSHEADTATTGDASVTAPDAPAPPSSPAPILAPPSVPPDQMGRSAAVEAAAPTTPEVANDGKAAAEARAQPATPPRPTPPSRGAATEPRRAAVAPPAPSRAAPAPAPECTPQVDALGLCAPGAKVSGR
jgi:ribosomal protein L40E